MSAADFPEMLTLWLLLPINVVTIAICFASGLYVYIDSHQRSKSRLFALPLSLAVCLVYWPLSIVAYMLVIVGIVKQAVGKARQGVQD